MVLHGWFSVTMYQQNGYCLYLQNSKEVQVTFVTDGYYHNAKFSDMKYVGVLEKFSRSFISRRYQNYEIKILEYPEFNTDDVLSENSLTQEKAE